MSYTLNYRGAKIDELLGQVDEQFIAEYNVSLYADITAAIAAGKQVLLKKDNALYPYIGQDATSAYTFAMVDEDAILQLFTVSTASVWATVSKQLQEELTFDAAPTDGSTNPVTSDGIYDAIEDAKAEAQEQSYDLLVTDTAQGAIATFPDGADDVPVKSLIAQITPVQSGTGDPAPDNIRPISGWTGANITRTGKNLVFSKLTGCTINSVGKIVENAGFDVCIARVKAGVTYTATMDSDLNQLIYAYYADMPVNGSTCIGERVSTTTMTFVADYDGYLGFRVTTGFASAQLEVGSTATTYEAYNGNTINVDWTSEAGTVYGGTLNVTTGELTVNKAFYTYDGTNYTPTDHSSGNIYMPLSASNLFVSSVAPITNTAKGSASQTSTAGYSYVGSKGIYFTPTTAYANAAAFATFATNTPVQMAIELTTPQTYQLTPTEVKTLLGDNNIFVDTGDVDVTYRADTALYIDKKLGA